MKAVAEWFRALVWSFVVLIFIKAMIGFPYLISGSSMQGTIREGDVIWVNKLKIGPRGPVTLLSLPFFHQEISWLPGTPSFVDWIQIPYFRLPGYSQISHDDVVVINYPLDEKPLDHKTMFVKRAVGLPGDTLLIRAGQLIRNGQPLDEMATITHEYHLTSDQLNWDSLNSIGVTEGGPIGDRNQWVLTLTGAQAELVKSKGWSKICEKAVYFPDSQDRAVLPYDGPVYWSADYFGPIYIPAKGDTLLLDSLNIFIYEHIIKNYEGKTVDRIQNTLIIDGEATSEYVFTRDYFFLLGDNRHGSNDSRMWGLVPESHVIGTAGRILFSYSGQTGFGWSRIFKSIE